MPLGCRWVTRCRNNTSSAHNRTFPYNPERWLPTSWLQLTVLAFQPLLASVQLRPSSPMGKLFSSRWQRHPRRCQRHPSRCQRRRRHLLTSVQLSSGPVGKLVGRCWQRHPRCRHRDRCFSQLHATSPPNRKRLHQGQTAPHDQPTNSRRIHQQQTAPDDQPTNSRRPHSTLTSPPNWS